MSDKMRLLYPQWCPVPRSPRSTIASPDAIPPLLLPHYWGLGGIFQASPAMNRSNIRSASSAISFSNKSASARHSAARSARSAM